MSSQSTNVFTYPPTEDQHVKNIMKIILECSGLRQDWIDFIKSDYVLYPYLLYKAVRGLVTCYTGREKQIVIPLKRNTLLESLKYCKPSDVRVVILGHDPVPDPPDLATGLAFSYPREKTQKNVPVIGPGSSVSKVHRVLRAAGFDPGDSLNHQHWARRGVLLLNACLTIDPDNRTEPKTGGGVENPHFKHWKNFTRWLLWKLLLKNHTSVGPPIFVLCWGTQARDVGDYLRSMFPEHTYTAVEYDDDHSQLLTQKLKHPIVFATGHHPTWPHPPIGKSRFEEQATNQFKAIRSYPEYSTLFDQDIIEVIKDGMTNLHVHK